MERDPPPGIICHPVDDADMTHLEACKVFFFFSEMMKGKASLYQSLKMNYFVSITIICLFFVSFCIYKILRDHLIHLTKKELFDWIYISLQNIHFLHLRSNLRQ